MIELFYKSGQAIFVSFYSSFTVWKTSDRDIFRQKEWSHDERYFLRRKTMPNGDERIFPLAAKYNTRFLRAPVGGDVIAFVGYNWTRSSQTDSWKISHGYIPVWDSLVRGTPINAAYSAATYCVFQGVVSFSSPHSANFPLRIYFPARTRRGGDKLSRKYSRSPCY